MGEANPESNPFMAAQMPHLATLLGEGWHLRPDGPGQGRITTARASLVPYMLASVPLLVYESNRPQCTPVGRRALWSQA